MAVALNAQGRSHTTRRACQRGGGSRPPQQLLPLLAATAAASLLLLLLLLLVLLPTEVAGSRHLGVSAVSKASLETVEVLTETDLAAAINRSNRKGVTVTALIKANIKLTRALPKLKGNGSNINAVGACADKANNNKPYRCVVDGGGKFAVFVMGVANATCGVSVRGLTFQRVRNGVLQGYCNFTARDCAFNNNIAVNIGGAVVNSGLLEVQWETFPIPALIRFCNFTNNTATNADGGAISSLYHWGRSGLNIDIAYSRFQGNRAINGSGGAIGLSNYGDTLVIREVTFNQNYAGKSGGAVRMYGESVLSYASAFTSNTAAKGQGGALSLEGYNEYNALFCNTTFTGNKAPTDGGKSNNILFEGDGSGTRLAFCSKIPKGVRGRDTNGDYEYDRNWSRIDCVGCTGCPKDCNGNGKCLLDSDFIPTCKCNEGFDPETSCASCLEFRNFTTKCTTCLVGFIPRGKGQGCAGCPGLNKIPYLADIYRYESSLRVSSVAKCAAYFNQTKQHLDNFPHWNVWAYIDGKAANKACRKSCVMFNNYIDKPLCESDRKLHYLPRYNLYYVGDEEDDIINLPGTCGPRT